MVGQDGCSAQDEERVCRATQVKAAQDPAAFCQTRQVQDEEGMGDGQGQGQQQSNGPKRQLHQYANRRPNQVDAAAGAACHY